MSSPVVLLDGLLLAGRHTGVENAILNLARALMEETDGCDVHLAAPVGTEAARVAGGQTTVHPVNVGRGSRMRRIWWEQMRLPALAAALGADVLHCPGYVMPVRYRGAAVLTVYDVLALTHPQWCSRMNALHYGALMPGSIRRARAVVVPAEAVKADLLRVVPVPEQRVRVVPLGVGPEYRRVADESILAAVRERHRLPERFVLTVGNIEPKKNVEGMVAAYDRIAADCPADLVVAGEPGWRCGAALAALNASQHRDRIHRLGYVPRADMPALYSLADVLLQWSRYEGFGLPPLEAMSCGTPAIVSDAGALPEVVGEGAVIVPLGEEAALGEAILALLGDPQRREAQVARGLGRAAEFTWRRHAGSVIGIYREVAVGA